MKICAAHYSSSKASAELVFASYFDSYFKKQKQLSIGSARAGNVIGGGDFKKDRIVPDVIKSLKRKKNIILRNPNATRPWQHVLEPLSGYLNLAKNLSQENHLHGEPFNFGPPAHQNHTVYELVVKMSEHWDQVRLNDISDAREQPYESGFLKLNCDKALQLLNWNSVLNFSETIRMTGEWYQVFYSQESPSVSETTSRQIEEYTHLATQSNLVWTQ